ncbi:MSHA biogenesis protein MshQ [Aeromonas caviae]|nr:MSHA biogenesis protein MshQ [Aeromonas caviae]
MVRWLMTLALSVTAPAVWASFDIINTGEIFPAVVQGHHGNNNNCHQISGNQLYQVNNPKINGTGGKSLNFCSINKDQNNTPRCDNGAGGYQVCQVTGADIRGLKLSGNNDFPSIGATNSLTCQSGQQTVPLASYGSITAENCVLTFPSRSEYQLKTLSVRNNATLQLGEGDYYIDQLTIDNGTIKLTGSGLIRIFINQDVKFVNTVNVNADNQGRLIWVNYNNMVLDNSTKFYGYLYTDNKLTMNNNAAIYGRVTARYLSMDAQSSINENVIIPPLSCFSDDFSASTLSSNWVVARSSGDFTPAIVNGRLGMTQASPKQSTSATYQRLFPAANNLVTIEFDHYAHGGNGADGMAVVLSDARVTPQPGAFGGPLGYGFKPEANGFAGGWLGVGIDEYGNFSGEGGSVNKGRRKQSVAVRGSGSGTSGYNYLRGTCNNGSTSTSGNCLSPTVDSGSDSNRPHRYRLTIDSRITGQSLVKVERNTEGSYSTLIDSFNAAAQSGQAAIPENLLLSLTGSTGDATNAHQIDNVRICALKSNPVGTQIDHFEFDHSGQALTCNPETLTIRACADASCSQLFTDPVSAILTPLKNGSNGWIADSQVSYNGNTATVTFSNGTAKLQLRNNLASVMKVGVSGSIPSTKPLSETLCRAGSGALSTAACTLSFADSGFLFNVPDTLANKPQQVVMTAVRKDNTSQLCVPSFQKQTKRITFWSDYNMPATNLFGSQIRIDKIAIATMAGAPTAMDLYFNELGETTLKDVSYPDAGQMRLNARHDGSGDTAGLVMTGSDLFVSRPAGLCITPTEGTCAAGDASCPVFKKTGEAFQLNIKGVAWQADDDKDLCSGNLATPNFALANIALGSELVAPKPGEGAVVGTASYDHSNAKGSNNLNTVTQSVNEVGVFRMTATPPEAGYFNYTIPPATSVPVGRFVPWDFNLLSSDVVPACEDMTAPERDFTYMSQPFGIKLEVVARNMAGGQTQNYTGLFAKGGAYITTANNKDGNSLSSRLRSLQPLPWLNGRAAFTGISEFVRLSDTQPDGPYKSLLFGLYMRDNDGDNSLIASPNFNDAVMGDCSGSGCNARLLDSVPMQVYFGRLLASTRQGAASAPLALPLQVQYFEGGGWKINQADVCTQLSLANEGFDPRTSLDPTRKISFNNGSYEVTGQVPGATQPQSFRSTLTLSGLAAPASVATANKGEILFHFSAPNAAVPIPFKIDLSKQPESEQQPGRRPLWLSDPDSLEGMAIFGRDRGNDRIIYRREVMP